MSKIYIAAESAKGRALRQIFRNILAESGKWDPDGINMVPFFQIIREELNVDTIYNPDQRIVTYSIDEEQYTMLCLRVPGKENGY